MACFRAIYEKLQNNYQWIDPSDSFKIVQLRTMMDEAERFGFVPDPSFSVERARSAIRRNLPGEKHDRDLINELSYTLLYARMIQSVLYVNPPEISLGVDYCSDSLLQATLLVALQRDDIYAGILDALPGDIGERLSWIHTFRDTASMEYGGYNVPVYKEDSAGCLLAARAALQAMGLLSPTDSLIDSTALFTAISIFQERNGLEPDGMIGKMTVDAFAKSNDERLRQLNANLARAQSQFDWQRGDNFMEVNVPEMTLRLYKDHQVLSTHKVVIGQRKQNKTPSFKASLNEIVVNPEWYVPFSISTKELLPKQLADPSYLVNNHYRVTNSYIESIDPQTIDWTELSEDYFPYRIIQEAGPWNALGKVKFLFPNRHLVYVHDTPSKSLFNKAQRDFSHGCIRVQDPFLLAVEILEMSNSKIDSTKFYALLDTAKNFSIPISPKIPVIVNYGSVRKNEKGILIFYNDIYGLDDSLVD